MRILGLMIALVLSGCAASPAGLARTAVKSTVPSNKSAQEFATCVAEVVLEQAELRGSGDHYWVLRENGVGIPVVRWDFTNQVAGGSIAELRATAYAGAAKDKVRACA
jgi:hypothetical protein